MIRFGAPRAGGPCTRPAECAKLPDRKAGQRPSCGLKLCARADPRIVFCGGGAAQGTAMGLS